QQVAIGLWNGTVLFRELNSSAKETRLQAHRARVHTLAFGPDGKLFVSADAAEIKVWVPDASGDWACVDTFPTVPPGQTSREFLRQVWVAIAPDGNYLAACSEGTSAVSLWNLANGAPAPPGFTCSETRLRGLALSPDGSLLAAGCEDNGTGGFLVWDFAT